MAKTHKTKTEMLQELESIKGLLLENDDIPLLQEVDISHQPAPSTSPLVPAPNAPQPEPHANPLNVNPLNANPLSHTQTSLFDDEPSSDTNINASTSTYDLSTQKTQDHKSGATARQPVKASGENPFLPQHIRERLHGNNPPPLFANVTARKIMNATKGIPPKNQRPRQHLIDEVITSMLPQIESELRHRLFAMSTDELENLLKNQD